jgi:hypothetical protein
MENTDQEQIIFKMETNSNINTIINTESATPEEIKQVKKSRGRPKTTQAQEERNQRKQESKRQQILS